MLQAQEWSQLSLADKVCRIVVCATKATASTKAVVAAACREEVTVGLAAVVDALETDRSEWQGRLPPVIDAHTATDFVSISDLRCRENLCTCRDMEQRRE